jgi:small subunit ribosomal protein S6
MTLAPPIYDLTLLLDTAAEEDVRAKIVADVEQQIRAEGELLRHDDWGVRALAYPIDHKTDAEYHLFQMHAKPPLLAELNRTLGITDGVVRFRTIKLKPGTPDVPELPAARRPEGEPVAAVAEPVA